MSKPLNNLYIMSLMRN